MANLKTLEMKISTSPNRNPWFSSHNHLSMKSWKKTQAVEYRFNLEIWKLDMKLPLTWNYTMVK